MRPSPNVLSIPPGARFLPTLIDALLDGRLIDGFAPGHDPLALAATTIWVPTRRAVRSLQDAFSERLGPRGAVLPMIRALGDDGDGESLHFAEIAAGLTPSLAEDAPTISGTARHIALARLVHAWTNRLRADERALYEGANIVIPSSLADAVGFAAELGELMDEMATEGIDWAAIERLTPEEEPLALWWQLTLRFLAIATEHWPLHLAQAGLADAAHSRVERLERQAAVYEARADADVTSGHGAALDPFAAKGPPNGPVIAAGSTGSIPATARLLKAIARLPQGAVVLPGLDRDGATDDEWALFATDPKTLDEADAATLPAHPQYGLARLLAAMRVGRDEVAHLSEAVPALRARELLFSAAMRPSSAVESWARGPVPDVGETHETRDLGEDETRAACAGLAIIDAPTMREQALAIAFALRDALAQSDEATAALVTPDRTLARRVSTELHRFGIAADDSAGTPLPNRPAGAFARLVMQVALAGAGGPGLAPRACEPLVLLSLLKHPLARFGVSEDVLTDGTRALEIGVLNGATRPPVAGTLGERVRAVRDPADDAGVADVVDRLEPEHWDAAEAVAGRIDALFAPFAAHDADSRHALSRLAHETIGLVEACAAPASLEEDGAEAEDSTGALYAGEDGEALAQFLAELVGQDDATEVEAGEWPAVFDRLMADHTVRPRGGTHPRIAILGPIEARLQHFDRIVLGSLDEGTWPREVRSGAFLSRAMRATLGLPAPERRIGLAAHDIAMLGCGPDVVLARAARDAGGPRVASRFLQRIAMQAGPAVSADMMARGQRFLDWAEAVDRPERTQAQAPPSPRPPIAERPTRLSVTEVQKLVENPYSIYARRVLGLSALDDPDRYEGDLPQQRGTLLHAVVERLSETAPAGDVEGDIARVHSIAAQVMREADVPDHLRALWQARAVNFAPGLVAWYRDHHGESETTHEEIGGRIVLDHLTLTCRADRIERMPDGTLRLFDYKTGNAPTPKAIVDGKAPQLPLEALIAREGGLKGIPAATTTAIGYVEMKDRGQFNHGKMVDDARKEGRVDGLVDDYAGRLEALVAHFRDPRHAYHSHWRPSSSIFGDDYDHLARVDEWGFADDGEPEA